MVRCYDSNQFSNFKSWINYTDSLDNFFIKIISENHLITYTAGKKLGSGAFGVVFKAEAVDIIDKGTTSIVAVKTVKPDTDPLYKKALASELKIMMNVGQHLNVVNLLGSCTTGYANKRKITIYF